MRLSFAKLKGTSVKCVTRAQAGYLAKYLTKEDRTEWLKHKRLWAAFGHFPKTKVKDIAVESNFTRAVQFCQRELQQSKLPFWLVSALLKASPSDPARLKLVCQMVRSGASYADVFRVLRE